ncbi:hypothetical protein EDC59_101690 [Pseudodesulfovibrio indicus]|jgi:hypothetical protein|uniref:Uncharacterized protein n=1 Tax=Pseudodesulfovibrio indicus TaxID=1716143 RepID=A0AA94PY22_9BACT|nr:hypothetical protein EDC59_101690 [Pseudodesulfovibrio indicus]
MVWPFSVWGVFNSQGGIVVKLLLVRYMIKFYTYEFFWAGGENLA